MAAADLVLSCEHGGCEVPARHAPLFAGHDALRLSHRGWDPGALDLATRMAEALGAPLFAATTTRLLVDLNRSIGHPRLFSELGAGLSRAERAAIVAAHHRPHRDAVEGAIARRIAAGGAVLHIASHSFTPVLDGVVRRADVGFLYDPRRPAETAFALRWMDALARRDATLRLRRNDPYRGRGDGLTALLRRRFEPTRYRGLELEVNQRFVEAGGEPWDRLRRDLVGSLGEALAAEPSSPDE